MRNSRILPESNQVSSSTFAPPERPESSSVGTEKGQRLSVSYSRNKESTVQTGEMGFVKKSVLHLSFHHALYTSSDPLGLSEIGEVVKIILSILNTHFIWIH